MASYVSGKQLAEGEMRAARGEIGRLTAAKQALEQENASLKATVEAARKSQAELQRRYDSDVPKGERMALLELVDEQIKAGAKLDRLRFLISAASHQEKCDGEPVTKRFLVRTPLYDGANSAVTLADSAITVTAMGEPAKSPEGLVQSWFDPAKPVAFEIARLGKKPGVITGKLPLQHAVVVNGYEYRLAFVAGERRGFVNVTADRCRFP